MSAIAPIVGRNENEFRLSRRPFLSCSFRAGVQLAGERGHNHTAGSGSRNPTRAGCPCLVDMYYNDRSLHSVSFDSRGKLRGRLPGLAVALTIHEADQRDIVVNFDADQLVSRKF